MRASSTPSPSPLKAEAVPSRAVTFSTAYPVALHWGLLLLFAGLALLGGFFGITPLLALSVFALVLSATGWAWSLISMRSISGSLRLAQPRAFPGETVEAGLELRNDGWLPVSWLNAELELPFRLIHGRAAGSPYSRERTAWVTALGAGQRLAWHHGIQCRARGEYRLGPVRLRSGDIFGLYPREKIEPVSAELLVYPRIVPVDRLRLTLSELTGERPAPSNMYEDASRTMGAREYRRDDSFKRIHWKASARQPMLQSRQYESTTSIKLVLMLDAATFPGPAREDDFELAVTTVASLASAVASDQAPVGVIAAGTPEIRIDAASGQQHLLRIMESLARIQAEPAMPLADLIEGKRIALPLGAALVIVAGDVSQGIAALVRGFQRRGVSVMLVVAGRDIPAGAVGLPATGIRSAGDLSSQSGEGRP